MRTSLLVIAILLATLTACGTPEEDKIVVKNLKQSGSSATYAKVRDGAANTKRETGAYDCAEFAASIAHDVEFPAGRDLYIKACEEGQKQVN
ncbi:hypothetical protein [Actinomadura violacea]|uniref:Lipoprotein n=1 Tax=Actinomadura violacea TaxID=2819934 RepID=A0ABS3S0X3_9ACTN|nr:hypothetical protein [Actinomadura violacea]MBO2462659.1 hypothetical protein [Actinomadura violacea]